MDGESLIDDMYFLLAKTQGEAMRAKGEERLHLYAEVCGILKAIRLVLKYEDHPINGDVPSEDLHL